jgi:restriction endonuclease Mrr
MTKFKDRRERASRRAAAGLSLKRLIKRGLLECCSRGHWRLTRAGVALARRLFPEIKPVTKRQLAANIGFHKAMQNWADTHPTLAGKRGRRTGS